MSLQRVTRVVLLTAIVVMVVLAFSASAAEESQFEYDYPSSTHSRGGVPLKALPSTEDKKEVDFIKALTVSNLRRYLRERDAKCNGCVERRHLVERAMEVRGWMTETERVVAELTPLQLSASNALTLSHLSEAQVSQVVPTADGEQQHVVITNDRKQLETIQRHHGIVCQAPMVNGTQYCHQQQPNPTA